MLLLLFNTVEFRDVFFLHSQLKAVSAMTLLITELSFVNLLHPQSKVKVIMN
jgi:hypothetical protein